MNDKMTPSGDGGDNNHKRPKNRQSIVIFLTFMLVSFLARVFDTSVIKKVPLSLVIGLFFCQLFLFYYLVIFSDLWYADNRGDYYAGDNI